MLMALNEPPPPWCSKVWYACRPGNSRVGLYRKSSQRREDKAHQPETRNNIYTQDSKQNSHLTPKPNATLSTDAHYR